MNYTLWEHQEKAYNDVTDLLKNGCRSPLCVIPTRGGKSGVASKLIEDYAVKNKMPVYFVAHTKILIDQMSQELSDHEIKHGIIAPYAPQIKYRVQVISKDSLFSRFRKMKDHGWDNPSLILVDEAHLSMSPRYKEILDNYSQSKIVGLTATPVRLDGKGLGEIFDHMVIGPSKKHLQGEKILCPIDTFAVEFDSTGLKKSKGEFTLKSSAQVMDKPKVLKDIVFHWEQKAKNKKTLTFCSTIDHAEDMAESFNDKGYPSVAISSKDGKALIKEKLDKFYAGEYINLCSVNLFLMGFTVKDCECVIQARHTASLMIYLQSIGRGEMYLPGKTLINIDCVNNWERHGKPEDDRTWSLEGDTKKEKEQPKYKRCPECLRPVSISHPQCEYCGFIWKVQAVSRIPEEAEGQLVKVGDSYVSKKPGPQVTIRLVARNANNLKEAIKICRDVGYKPQFGRYIWNKVFGKKVRSAS